MAYISRIFQSNKKNQFTFLRDQINIIEEIVLLILIMIIT